MSTINAEYRTPPDSATNTATTTSSTAAVAIGGNGFFTFKAKLADVHILFGTSNVAAATTSNGLYIAAGSGEDWYIPQTITHFRVIATSTVTGQALSWGRSGS